MITYGFGLLSRQRSKGGPMKNLILYTVAVVLVAGCSRTVPENSKSTPTASSTPQASLAKGAGNWVVFTEEQSLDVLIDKTIELPYLTTGVMVSPGGPVVKRMRVTLRPTPLTPSDRCGLQVVAVTAITAEGKECTAAATGHVTDNSDGMLGMRIDVSRNAGAGLVIPANASGTVIFEQDVILHLSR